MENEKKFELKLYINDHWMVPYKVNVLIINPRYTTEINYGKMI